MGEIGIPRRDFLYDMSYWEVTRIAKGYRRRHRLTHQLLAECVFATIYSMRSSEGKTVMDMFPSLFDDEQPAQTLTAEEVADLQNLIRETNKSRTGT